MNWKTVAAVALGIGAGLAVCMAIPGRPAFRRPKPAAAQPSRPAPAPTGEKEQTVAGELLYLRFPGCGRCDQACSFLEERRRSGAAVRILDVLAEENEAMAEKYFRGAATHGALARTQGKVVWSAPCQNCSRETLSEGIVKIEGPSEAHQRK